MLMVLINLVVFMAFGHSIINDEVLKVCIRIPQGLNSSINQKLLQL